MQWLLRCCSYMPYMPVYLYTRYTSIPVYLYICTSCSSVHLYMEYLYTLMHSCISFHPPTLVPLRPHGPELWKQKLSGSWAGSADVFSRLLYDLYIFTIFTSLLDIKDFKTSNSKLTNVQRCKGANYKITRLQELSENTMHTMHL